MNFDAIIVGAGPIGSTVAKAIAREGYEALILEEHSDVGLPQHCAGKISVNAAKELSLPNTGILQSVRGATFYSPDMSSLSVERRDIQAHIFDREILDRWLSDTAVDAGATLLTGTRVIDVSISSHGATVWFKHNEEVQCLTSRIVVGADGASSFIARRLGLYSKERSMVRVAIQREITNIRDVRSGFVEIYLGERYAPGFLAWIVPTGENSAKVGIGVKPLQSKYLLNYLECFITSHPIASKKLEGCLCMRQTAHIIPTGGTLRRTISDGVLIVGDAAGQVKSTTGGGLYYGMVCAEIAGQIISKALASTSGILQKNALMEYQNRWQGRFGKEIEMNAKMRLILDSLTDNELNYLFSLIRKDEELIDMIDSKGDIDWQSGISRSLLTRIISALVKRPQLLLKLGRLLS